MATTIQGKVRPAQIMAVALLFFLLSASSMAQDCKGKSSWPELVGLFGQIAPLIIKTENPNVKESFVIKEGTVVPLDFRCDRVRVWVKPNGIVYKPPTIG